MVSGQPCSAATPRGSLGVALFHAQLFIAHLGEVVALLREPLGHLFEEGLDLVAREGVFDAAAGEARDRHAELARHLGAGVRTREAQLDEPLGRRRDEGVEGLPS